MSKNKYNSWFYIIKVIESCTCVEQLHLIHNWVINTTCKYNFGYNLDNPEFVWDRKYTQLKYREKILNAS